MIQHVGKLGIAQEIGILGIKLIILSALNWKKLTLYFKNKPAPMPNKTQ